MVPNNEQLSAWNGETGRHYVAQHERHRRMHAPLAARLLAAADPRPGQRVLDIGCGCGDATIAAARRVTDGAAGGHALGVDPSEPMLAVARAQARDARVRGAGFLRADAQVHPFDPAAFDAAFSCLGVMFFADPGAAFRNVAAALRPGARLAFLCWQNAELVEYIRLPFGVIAAHTEPPPLRRADAPGPFSLDDPRRIRTLLGGAGFGGIRIEGVTGRMAVGSDVEDAIAYYKDHPTGRQRLAGLPSATIAAIDADLRHALGRRAGPGGVWLGYAAWLVTAEAGG
ncbi:MAG TPA: class I SAM-dependent methyltransferase [Streptosporangiaceae bacterium]